MATIPRWSTVPLLAPLGCTIANSDYGRGQSTDVTDVTDTASSDTTATATLAPTTTGATASETSSSDTTSDSGGGELPSCEEPQGEEFDVVITDKIEQLMCGDLVEMMCDMTIHPNGNPFLENCNWSEGPLPSMELQLHPEGLDPDLIDEAQVLVRILYNYIDMDCQLRFFELYEASDPPFPPNPSRLLFAGAQKIPSPAEFEELDVIAIPDPEATCACEDEDSTVCCDHPPGEYRLEFTLDDTVFSVSMEDEVESQMIGPLEYEAHNLYAFHGPGCGERLDAHWFVRLVPND